MSVVKRTQCDKIKSYKVHKHQGILNGWLMDEILESIKTHQRPTVIIVFINGGKCSFVELLSLARDFLFMPCCP